MAAGQVLVYEGQVLRELFSDAISCRVLHMLRREASLGCGSNSGRPTDMHLAQLPSQPAAQRSSQDESKENGVTWPAGMPLSKPYLSVHCLGYSELLIDAPWQPGNKGPAKKGLNVLQKWLEKSEAQT